MSPVHIDRISLPPAQAGSPHRSTLRAQSVIRAFDAGRIVERGSRNGLMSARRRHYDLFTKQASRYTSAGGKP